ncbi:MAG: hypothetical protein U9Q83_00455 [Bacteroidota bacterium]|nr:hypothetical protein [Bacteroidota bacterium]
MKKTLFFISLMFVSFIAFSQVRAFLDTNVIDFANQTVLHIQINNPNNQTVLFPEFENDTISDDVEIVESLLLDTFKTKPLILDKKYIITSFEDSVRTISALPVIVGKDTFWTTPMQLYVVPLQMDSDELAGLDTTKIIPSFDIKEPYDAKFTFKEFWLRFGRWILLFLLISAIIALIVWLIIRYKNNKPIILLEKPKEPAHITALKRLEELKNKKLFQNNKTKVYYSELTDILRMYIELRFRIFALERTSNEIILDFRTTKKIENDKIKELQTLLNVSDLAKFAKYLPTQDVCQTNFNEVVSFVKSTKENTNIEKQENIQ